MPPFKKTKATSVESPIAESTPSAVPATSSPKTAAPEVRASESKPVSPAKPAATKPAASVQVKEVTFEMINERAYYISINRNWDAGTQDGDWHEAERQLRAEQ